MLGKILSAPDEGILAHLLAQRGVRAVAGDHRGVLVEAVQAQPDRTLDRRRVAAPQVGAADATAEQGVAGDQQLRPGNQKLIEPGVCPGVCSATPQPQASSSSSASQRSGAGTGV